MAQASPIPLTAQQTFIRAALLGMLKASPIFDRFCGWVLAIGGAVLGFLLGKLDSIQPYLSTATVKRFAWIFLIAFILGFLEKLAASMVEAGISGAEEAEATLIRLFRGEVEVIDAPFSPETVLAELTRTVWYPMRWLVRFGARKGTSDPIAGLKYSVKFLQVQFFLAIGEVITVLVAVSALLLGIR
jgi:hypothetical protein